MLKNCDSYTTRSFPNERGRGLQGRCRGEAGSCRVPPGRSGVLQRGGSTQSGTVSQGKQHINIIAASCKTIWHLSLDELEASARLCTGCHCQGPSDATVPKLSTPDPEGGARMKHETWHTAHRSQTASRTATLAPCVTQDATTPRQDDAIRVQITPQPRRPGASAGTGHRPEIQDCRRRAVLRPLHHNMAGEPGAPCLAMHRLPSLLPQTAQSWKHC